MDTIKIEQARLGIKASFEFGDDLLTYVTSDRSGERKAAFPYMAIDPDNKAEVAFGSAKPLRYLWAAGVALGFSALRIDYGHQIVGETMGLVAITLIVLGIIAKDRRWFTIRVDTLPVAGSHTVVRILHDHRRDDIIEGMRKGRRNALRTLYAKIDPDADPEVERARFGRLLAAGIIDEDEHAATMMLLDSDVMDGPAPAHAFN